MEEKKKKGKVSVDITRRNSIIIGFDGNIIFEEDGEDREVKQKQAQFLNSKRRV